MTGTTNGTVVFWENGKIKRWKKIFEPKSFDNWTLVLFKDDRIFASFEKTDVVELNMNLNIIKKFEGRDSQPTTMDANENFLAVGYECITYVHSRKELNQNGTNKKIMVRL